jgi:hypothetical protein
MAVQAEEQVTRDRSTPAGSPMGWRLGVLVCCWVGLCGGSLGVDVVAVLVTGKDRVEVPALPLKCGGEVCQVTPGRVAAFTAYLLSSTRRCRSEAEGQFRDSDTGSPVSGWARLAAT